MKYEGYFSNVWFTVVFGTPVLAFLYYLSDKTSFIAFDLSSLALFFYFFTISFLVLVPVVLLHYQVYRKIGKTKLSSLISRLLFAFSAILIFSLVVLLLRLLSESSTYFLYPLYPFYLTPVLFLYLFSIVICSFAYKLKTKEVDD